MNVFVVRRVTYFLLAKYDKFVGKRNDLFILCYHSIGNDNWRFCTKVETFKKQIRILLKRYEAVQLCDVYDVVYGRKRLNNPSFAITFDDGYKDILKIKDFLKGFNIRPALFIVSDRQNARRDILKTQRDFLSDRDLVKLKNLGWEIGSHSSTHRLLAPLDEKELEEEIKFSKIDLENRLSTNIKFFAYPKGNYSKKVLQLVKKSGYKLALSMDDGEIKKGINTFRVPRIGVDATHNISEFQSLFSPSVMKFRKLVKTSFMGRFI